MCVSVLKFSRGALASFSGSAPGRPSHLRTRPALEVNLPSLAIASFGSAWYSRRQCRYPRNGVTRNLARSYCGARIVSAETVSNRAIKWLPRPGPQHAARLKLLTFSIESPAVDPSVLSV
jgi:hypothetical protein